MDRRTVLKGGITVALTAHTAVASGEALPSTLGALIGEHDRLLALDKAARSVVEELTERLDTTEGGHRLPCVQTSSLYQGRDDDGNEIKTPIYSYSEAAIEKVFADNLRSLLFLNPPSRHALVKAGIERRLAETLAEFRVLKAAYDQREKDIGMMAASETAQRTADAVRSIEAQIVGFVPASLAEAIQKAAWCVQAYRSDDAYLKNHVDDHESNPLLAALEAIGMASV